MVRNRCIDIVKKDSLIDNNVQPSDLEGIISEEECEERSYDEARLWTAIDSLPEKCREVFLLAKRDGMKYEEIAVRMNISVAIDSLPEKCREVFLLAKCDGMKYDEIAVRMNISVNTVKNQMNKALKNLKEGIRKVYMFFFG